MDKQNKQKTLLPTLKERQRYIVYEILRNKSSLNIESNNIESNFAGVHNNVLEQCNSMLGIFESAKAGLQLIKYDKDTTRGVIRVDNKYVNKLKICLGLIKSIQKESTQKESIMKDQTIMINPIYVSGLLNKAIATMENKG